MTKKYLLDELSSRTGLSKKDCNNVYSAFLNIVTEEVNKDLECKVDIPLFGTIRAYMREAYSGRNPQDGSQVDCPRKRCIRLRFLKSFKDKFTLETISENKLSELKHDEE